MMAFLDHHRLSISIAGSLVINFALWGMLAAGASRVVQPREEDRIEVQRLIIDNRGKRVVKVVRPEEVKKKIEKIVKEKSLPKKPPPPPAGAHNKVITSKAPPVPSSEKPDGFTALPGGNADVGKPTNGQNVGDEKTNPPVTPPPPPPPPKKEDPPAPPKKEEAPPPPPPKKEDPPPPPPKTEEPPKPVGPTRDAEPTDQVQPEIPDRLKDQQFKSFVRVKVEIAEDGSFEVVLRTSSGNADVDRIVLDALKRWKWKPALKNGVPTASTQLFKFEIEIR